MIVGQMAKVALPIAIFLTVVSGLLLLAEHPGTAGFVITALTLMLGVIFLIVIVVILCITRRPPSDG